MQPEQHIYAMVTFRKAGRLRFLGHLDVVRTMKRAIRRAGLPVAYSQGFSPSPQMSFASALPLGTAGESEVCAIRLERVIDARELYDALAAQLPADLGLVDVRVIEHGKRKLYEDLKFAEYEVEFQPTDAVSADDLANAVDCVIGAGNLRVMRETKSRTLEVDIRPGIRSLRAVPADEDAQGLRVVMAIACESDKLVKPAEVIECIARALACDAGDGERLHIRRTTRLGFSE
jgi:radical SAM-linked protein